MARNLIIADPGLVSETGHHFHVSMKYAEAAEALGMDIKILAHVDYMPKELNPLIVHGFTYNLYDWPRWLRPKTQRTLVGPTISNLVKDLMRVGPALDLSAETLVYFHSCSLSLVNDLLDYFLVVPVETAPCFMLRLIYEQDPSGATYPTWYIDQLRRKLRYSGLVGRNVFFSAETQVLADQVASTLEVPCERIHHIATNADPTASAGVMSPNHISLAFLGDARREKGYQLLPEVAKALSSDEALAAACELVVQAKASAIDPTETETTSQVKSALLELSNQLRVTFVDSRLDDYTYNGLVNETDIALLLHDPQVYRTRGSAIYYDAALAGKCLIVREGSSMAADHDFASIVVWKRNERFVDALRRAVDLHHKLADGTLDTSIAALRSQCDPKNILTHLASVMENRLAGSPPPVAMQIMPAWFGEGSSHVFRAQTEYFANRGFRVADVVVVTWDGAGESEPDFYERLFEGTKHHTTFYTFFIQRPPEQAGVENGSLSSASYNRLSFNYEAKWLLDADLPAGLVRMIAANEPSISLVNYAHYASARGLLGRGKILLEMHDLRSRQYAIERGSRDFEGRDILQEIRSAATADGIIFINEREEAVFKEIVSRKTLNSAAAFPVTRGEAEENGSSDLDDKRDLLETFFAATDQQRTNLRAFAWPAGVRQPNLMFVGSGHVSNTVSLDWFLSEVFLPYLLPLGMKLHVFGSIAKRYQQTVPGVVFHGTVRHIRPLYQFADIVVLPIKAGTGLPIKSLDAIRARVPLVATTNAFEAIANAGEFLTFFDEPTDFAHEILSLASDEAKRRNVRERVSKMAEIVIDRERYYKTIDTVAVRSGVTMPGKTETILLSQATLNDLRMARLFRNWNSVSPMLSSFVVLDMYLKLEFTGTQADKPIHLTVRSDAVPLKMVIRVSDGPPRLCVSETGRASILILPEQGKLPVLELFATDQNNFASTSRLEFELAQSPSLQSLQIGNLREKQTRQIRSSKPQREAATAGSA
jgi:hypothetical protein